MDMSGNIGIPSFGAPTLEGFDLSNLREGERVRGKNRQLVRFYWKRVSEPVTTQARIDEITGSSTPIKIEMLPKDVEMVEIVTPGDKNIVDCPASDYHKREYWPQYKAFRDGRGTPIGKPIDECMYISPSVATELRYLGVQTEEQLADASDLLCNNVADGWRLRDYARVVCKTTKDSQGLGQVHVLKGQLEVATQNYESLKVELEQLKGKLFTSKSKTSKKDSAPTVTE